MLPSRYSRISLSLGLGVLVEERRRGHHHARGAEAALQAVVGLERRLDHAERAVGVGHALDRAHLGAVDVERQHVAGLHRDAVDVHDAGAALRGVAADVGAGQPQALAQELHEERPPLHLARDRAAVDGHRYLGHAILPGCETTPALARRFSTVSMAASVERHRAAAKGFFGRGLAAMVGAHAGTARERDGRERRPGRLLERRARTGLGDPCRRPRRHARRGDRPAARRDRGRAGGGGARHRLRGGRDDAGLRRGGRARPAGCSASTSRSSSSRVPRRGRQRPGSGGSAGSAPTRRPTRCRAASTRRSRASG